MALPTFNRREWVAGLAQQYGLPAGSTRRDVFDLQFAGLSADEKVQHIDKLVRRGKDPSGLIARSGAFAPTQALGKGGGGSSLSTSTLAVGIGALLLLVAVLR